MTSRSPLWLSAAAILAIGVVGPLACFPVTKGAPCAADSNCPTGQQCVAGMCSTEGGSGGGTTQDGGPGGGSGGGATDGGSGGGVGGFGGGGSGGSGGGTGGTGGGAIDAGPIDAGSGEASFGTNACFDGADNDSDGKTDCADPDCAGALCRSTLGPCDKPEVCTNLTCPANALSAPNAVCRPKAGDCDLDEVCSGNDAGCPPDVLLGTGAPCRPANGLCDVAETCTGTATCPSDRLEVAGKVCRPGNLECDLEEKCTGVDAGCPPDGLQPSSHVCRASAGGCDTAELCTSGTGTCPADVNACPSNQYCGGSTCVPKQGDGANCTTASQCTSGNCVDGVCCDGLCAGPCDACNLLGSVGQCKPKPATTQCRAAVDTCDVEEKCTGTTASCPPDSYAGNTTPCGTSSCLNGNLSPPPSCNGSGTCVVPATTSCGLYLCNGPACFMNCTANAQCISTAYCSAGSCKPKSGNGTGCATGAECTSGNCVDGVCCDGPCTGGCEACNLAVAPGQCKPHPSGTDPESSCGAYNCDGASACASACGAQVCAAACKAANFCQGGSCVPDLTSGTCTAPCQCASGNCVDGYCCNSPCTGACSSCNQFGQEGTCRPHASGTDPENGCGSYTCDGSGFCFSSCSPASSCPTSCKAAAYCTAAGCGPDQMNGATCTASCQCASGTCGTFYPDADNDGFGAGASIQVCAAGTPAGYSTNNADCDDSKNTVNPNATEVIGDQIDQTCDGKEVCFLDGDNDGYRTTATILSNDPDCLDTQEAVVGDPTGDCCDTDPSARPGQTAWFTTPRSGCGTGSLAYDYNCDGTATLRYPSVSGGTQACTGSPPCIALNGIGWTIPLPACGGGGGATANYRDCSVTTTCSTTNFVNTQSCH